VQNKLDKPLPWSEIDTVLLDMDGTLLDLGFDNFFWLEYLPKIYAEKNSLSLQQSKHFLAQSYGAIEGKLQWYCLDFWSERLKLDIAELKYSVREKVAFRPGALSFLKFIQQQNKQCLLATNAHPKSLEIKLLCADFHQYFDELVSSHQFGHPKEEIEFWRFLQRDYPFDPERTLFVDDSVKILKVAQQFGIGHLRAISQPDLNRATIDTTPFYAIHNFSKVISHAD